MFIFLINMFSGNNVAPLSSIQLDFGFFLETFVASTSSLALLATALQLDAFEMQLQFLNLQIRADFIIGHRLLSTARK
jgi:hypothetical protein